MDADGASFVLRSTDLGRSWTHVPVGHGAIAAGVVRAGGRFYAIPRRLDDALLVSTDGSTWNVEPIGAGDGNGVFALAASADRLLAHVLPLVCGVCIVPPALFRSSGDGQWTRLAYPPVSVERLGSTGGGFFVADRYGDVTFSADGDTWIAQEDPSISLVNAIAALGEGFVAATGAGHILTGTPRGDAVFANGFDE